MQASSANVGVGLSHLVEAASALANLTASKPASSGVDLTGSPEEDDGGNVVSDEEWRKGGDSLDGGGNSLSARLKREIFPQRLMAILNDDSLSDVVTWLPHGRSFVIIRPDVFTDKVLPKYLPPVDARSGTKYPSFTRKLNRWGFRQATRGPDTGAFHHPLFRRDKPELCLEMVCQRSRERKAGGDKVVQQPTTNKQLPLKKRTPSSADLKIAPLTKEALEAMTPEESTNNTKSIAAVSVSDDARSEGSQSITSDLAVTPPLTGIATATSQPTVAIPKGITSDRDFIAETLKRRDEVERLRVAKVMLYDAYRRAMLGK